MVLRKDGVEKHKVKKVGVVSQFSIEFFLSHTTLRACIGTLLSCRVFSLSNLCMDKREVVPRLFIEQPMSQRTENFLLKKFLFFRKNPVSNLSMDRSGVVSRISVEKFLSLSTKKFVRESLLCFRNIPVSTIFMDGREWWYHKLLLSFFLSDSTSKHVE